MAPPPTLPLNQFPRDAAAIRNAFRVPWTRHLTTRLACNHPAISMRLGEWESKFLAERLAPIQVDRPIYIAGLARSGSTALLECITAFPGIASHRYRDFPWVFTPYWWNQFLERAPRRKPRLRPRIHADGLAVSPESAEALEEPLWLAAFSSPCTAGAIEQWQSSVTMAQGDTDRFANFYRRHVQKLLLVRGGNRYACKGNYHVARLEYLLSLFPDARFVVPIRRPADHVASLIKQHRLFVDGETAHPRALEQMNATGHFEFGLGRRAIVLDDPSTADSIEQLWTSGEEPRAWARYWSHVYGYLARRIAANPALAKATLIVRYENLCCHATETLTQFTDHCQLDADPALRESLAEWLHAPTYYQPEFTPAEQAVIEEETQAVARQFGYRRESAHLCRAA
jgi:hypothetical protein